MCGKRQIEASFQCMRKIRVHPDFRTEGNYSEKVYATMCAIFLQKTLNICLWYAGHVNSKNLVLEQCTRSLGLSSLKKKCEKPMSFPSNQIKTSHFCNIDTVSMATDGC